MPSILSEADKETVKRTIPKASNKILAVAVARLYVAYPKRNRWTWTGLQGAAVLCNDLVGNTFFLKIVDISSAHRGVIWDQEIYDTFQYNQDRTFFHSFELEHPDCMAGLSFADEKEAKKFKQKMDEREKSASKATKAQPFASNSAGGVVYAQNGQNGGTQKSHSKVGAFFRSHKATASPPPPPPPQPSSLPAPPFGQPAYGAVNASRSQSRAADTIDLADPTWQPILKELMEMGISEDAIMQNADFIKDYIKQKQQEELKNGLDSAVQHLGPYRQVDISIKQARTATSASAISKTATPQLRFRAPPPLADAGKTALDDESPHSAFRVPPPFSGDRKSSAPAAPSRGPVPPPPPSREPISSLPPALPPKRSTCAAYDTSQSSTAPTRSCYPSTTAFAIIVCGSSTTTAAVLW
ncbi:hypothetical protein DV735_g2194, partial [Chaetothyriales sp. CBS 134920]